jgi:hypothetical protein
MGKSHLPEYSWLPERRESALTHLLQSDAGFLHPFICPVVLNKHETQIKPDIHPLLHQCDSSLLDNPVCLHGRRTLLLESVWIASLSHYPSQHTIQHG